MLSITRTQTTLYCFLIVSVWMILCGLMVNMSGNTTIENYSITESPPRQSANSILDLDATLPTSGNSEPVEGVLDTETDTVRYEAEEHASETGVAPGCTGTGCRKLRGSLVTS